MRTASYPYNNRHRQAPSTHTDKQAVRTMMIANNFDYPRVHFECHTPEQNWRFCCLRTFQFYYVLHSFTRMHSKVNHFSQIIKVLDCFLLYPGYFRPQNYTFKLPTLVRMKFILSQTHTALAGSRLYFHPSRSNLFAGASDNGLCRRKALSTTLRLAYPR